MEQGIEQRMGNQKQSEGKKTEGIKKAMKVWILY